MSRTVSRGAASVAVAALLIALTAAPALAHEQRHVGAYQFTVGWQHEPTYTGTGNAVALFIHDAKGTPIDDIGNPPTLKVTVSTGTQTSDPLDLKASFDPDTGLGTHSEFDAAVIPTTPGTYTFHFTGTLNGQAVDEKFTSSDKTFDNVQSPTAAEFPTKDPTPGDLNASLGRLSPRIDTALAAAKSAKDKGSSAGTLAVVALVVGIVLGGAGIVVGVTGRRRNA
jgi:hypothetical protein